MDDPTSSAWAWCFYEFLTGRRPFTAESQTKRTLLDLIATTEARPPRQIDDTIPKELERICLKALSKRASERYTTARDMAEDLRLLPPDRCGNYFSRGCTGLPSVLPPARPRKPTPVPTTPRPSDSDQRPDQDRPQRSPILRRARRRLLPGTACPDLGTGTVCLTASGSGRPASRETDPDKTFRVGLIYGPSGCGKSSLVKAGLLPRLAKHVLPVYIEATPEETETRLLKALRKACPDLPPRTGAGRFPGARAARTGAAIRSEGAAGPGPVRAMAACQAEARRTRNWSPPCGSAMASMSRRS